MHFNILTFFLRAVPTVPVPKDPPLLFHDFQINMHPRLDPGTCHLLNSLLQSWNISHPTTRAPVFCVFFPSDFHHAGDIFVAEVAGTAAQLCVCQGDAVVSDFSNFLCLPLPSN